MGGRARVGVEIMTCDVSSKRHSFMSECEMRVVQTLHLTGEIFGCEGSQVVPTRPSREVMLKQLCSYMT